MKKMLWFKHPMDLSNDKRMSKLINEEGAKGYGTYMYIMETLYIQADGKLAFSHLNTMKRKGFSKEYMENIVRNYGLFGISGDEFEPLMDFDVPLSSAQSKKRTSEGGGVGMKGVTNGEKRFVPGVAEDEKMVVSELTEDEKGISSELMNGERMIAPELRNNERFVARELAEDEKMVMPELRNGERMIAPGLRNNERFVAPELTENEKTVMPDLMNNEGVVAPDLMNSEGIVALGLTTDEGVAVLELATNEAASDEHETSRVGGKELLDKCLNAKKSLTRIREDKKRKDKNRIEEEEEKKEKEKTDSSADEKSSLSVPFEKDALGQGTSGKRNPLKENPSLQDRSVSQDQFPLQNSSQLQDRAVLQRRSRLQGQSPLQKQSPLQAQFLQSDQPPLQSVDSWQKLVSRLTEDSSWLDIACMQSGYGALLISHIKDAVELFRLHIQVYDKGGGLLTMSDVHSYFVNFVRAGTRTSHNLFKQLQDLENRESPVPNPYRFEQRVDGKRTYMGCPIPDDAPPRPTATAVWNEEYNIWMTEQYGQSHSAYICR